MRCRQGPAAEDVASEVFEAEVWEWVEEQGVGDEGSGGAESLPLFLPMPTSWRPQRKAMRLLRSFLLSAPLSFTLAFLSFVIFLGARHIFLGQA